MNNLNDPPNWNIRPDSRADGGVQGGGGGRWNYALLVPMLGLAAFRKSFSLTFHLLDVECVEPIDNASVCLSFILHSVYRHSPVPADCALNREENTARQTIVCGEST